jgi:hypothetical protein
VDLTISLTYSDLGELTAVSRYGGIALKAIKTLNFTVLEGFAGDHDNNRSVDLILMNSDTGVRKAVLIEETFTERGIGYYQEIYQLTCTVK